MTSLRDLKYRSVYNGIIVSRNKENTVGLFNSIDDINKVFNLDILNEPLNKGVPYNFSRAYPDVFGYEVNSFVLNWHKDILWSENGLCFIVLEDGRVLVGAPRVP